MNAQLVFYIGKKLAHFVKEFEDYTPEVGELDPETETRDAVIKNPLFPDDPAESIYIEFGEEFTVYWHSHSHFSPEDYWYDMMVERVHDILEGRFFSAVLADSKGKTIAAAFCNAEKVSPDSADAIFDDSLSDEAAVCRVYVWGRDSLEIPLK